MKIQHKSDSKIVLKYIRDRSSLQSDPNKTTAIFSIDWRMVKTVIEKSNLGLIPLHQISFLVQYASSLHHNSMLTLFLVIRVPPYFLLYEVVIP